MALICPSCTKNNSDNALHCKHCGAGLMGAVHVPNPSIFQPRNIIIAAAALLVVAAVTGNLGAIFPAQPNSDPDRFASQLAYEQCKEAIAGQLVAPSTAAFMEFDDLSRGKDGTVHYFRGNVESQNALGVPLVSLFECRVDENEAGEYRVNSAEVLE